MKTPANYRISECKDKWMPPNFNTENGVSQPVHIIYFESYTIKDAEIICTHSDIVVPI